MASKSLGTLTIDMVLKTTGLKQGMDKAERDMDAHARKMNELGRKIGVGIGTAISVGIAGVISAGGFFAAITKDAIDFADQMRDMSLHTGIGVEKLSELAYAARSTGVDLQTLEGAMTKLAKAAREGMDVNSSKGKLFAALGISVDDLKNLETLVPKLADAFAALPESTTKTALALELMGRSGAELIEFMNQGSDGLKDFADRARELGIIIDEETAAKADQFKDSLDDVQLAVKGLGIRVASELLPKLLEFSDWLMSFTKDGTNAAAIADGIASSVSALGRVFGFVTGMARQFGIEAATAIQVAQGAEEVARNFSIYGFMQPGTVKHGAGVISNALQTRAQMLQGIQNDRLRAAYEEQLKQLERAGSWVNDGTRTPRTQRPDRTAALDALLNRATGGARPRGGGRSSAMSEADREAQRLLETYNRLTEQQKEQLALFGATTEEARMAYRTQSGDLAKLSDEQKNLLILGARRLDQAKKEQDMYQRSLDLDARRAESMRSVVDAITDEMNTLGMTNEQIELYNNLKRLGTDASPQDIAQVEAMTEALQQQRKTTEDLISIQDEWRSGLSDALVDIVTGAKSLKEAFRDFFDDFARRVTQMIADRWIEQLFGQKGSSSTGSAGGFLSSLFGAMFGGGRASGGAVSSGRVYEVGEGNRPELLMAGGREYMIPGNNGRVVPLSGAGGGMNQTVNISVRGDVSRQTAEQAAREVARQTRRAMVRA